MVVTPSKKNIKNLRSILQSRIDNLDIILTGRELSNNREGCKGRKYWGNPMSRTAITKEELEIAVDDFKTVLTQIRKIK